MAIFTIAITRQVIQMSTIYILIPIAIIFTAVAIYLFFWAVKTEQFDDLEKQGMSILFDDQKQPIKRPSDDEKANDKTHNFSDLNKPTE